MLGIKQSTQTPIIHWETGQIPPSVECILNVLKFVKNLNCDNSLVKQVYNDQLCLKLLFKTHDNNIYQIRQTLAFNLK